MTESDRPTFAGIIVALASTLPGKEPTAATIEGYWRGLRDLNLADLQRAANEALATCRFIPTPVELRELAGEVKPDDRAPLAWLAVLEAHRVHGYYHSVTFDDPVINAAILAMGGWEAFDERLEAEGEKWTRKEFEQTYARLCRSGVSEERCRPLIGHLDRMNALHGHREAVKQPVLIATDLPAQRTAIRADSIGRRYLEAEATKEESDA